MYALEVPFLDLEQVFNSAQNLRWFKLKGDRYIVQDGSSAIKVEQQKQRLLLSCTEEEFYEKWFHYFDMETDYAEAYFSVARQSKFLKVCAVRSGGVRIIRQDLFECLIASIVHATIPDLNVCKFVLNSVARMCGIERKQSIRGAGKVTWYEFPTPEAIMDGIDKLILGTKTRDMILSVCELIVEGWLDLDMLRHMNVEEARDYLLDFICDDKAIDYICLYGLHDLGWLPQCKFADKVKALKMRSYQGVLYSYVMHHKLNPPKKIENEMKVGGHRWG